MLIFLNLIIGIRQLIVANTIKLNIISEIFRSNYLVGAKIMSIDSCKNGFKKIRLKFFVFIYKQSRKFFVIEQFFFNIMYKL